MSKYNELVYLILDEVKGTSDDFTYTEDHIIYLIDSYRSFLLKQRYSDVKKQIPESNFQTICLELMQVPAISGEPCEGGTYLRSKVKIPYLLQITAPRVTSLDFFQGEFNYVPRNRMRYVGFNRFTKNMIYSTIGPDGYLYLKSNNPQYLYLENVKVTGVFEKASDVSKLSCDINDQCDALHNECPIEEALVVPLVELVIKELLGAAYRPKDSTNDSSDNMTIPNNKGQ